MAELPVGGVAEDGMSAAGTWIELSVAADHEAVEAVSEILGRACAGAVAVEPAFELVAEGLAARVDTSRPQLVRGFLPAVDKTTADLAIEQVREHLGHLQAFGLRPIGELQTRLLHEEDWADAWKSHFPVLKVGRRLVIRPTWREHQPAADDVVLALDPGMAFGTGLHPTTRLCLAALEQLADGGLVEGARVLDVGCGSGVLAIAAGLLGAHQVVGLDTDPIAVEATMANGARNGLAGRLAARQGSLPSADGPFDLVVANLISSLLIELAPLLAASVRTGGRLVASGIFIDREPEVLAALEHAGLERSGRSAEGDWVALELARG
ncbi:MAG TPA: 50S ribosomal protein L11 methyltransferase [Candidatus Limnocylindrales bacterium]|nr:50S ribosomal protein L11 methyltransferase [Candidatus Limnocylindrales bacterium]